MSLARTFIIAFHVSYFASINATVIPALSSITCAETTTESYDSTTRDICWIKIASCIEENSPTTWHETQTFIQSVLPHAISIKFVPPGSKSNPNYNTYAVVAKPCSNPVWAINNEFEVTFTLNTANGEIIEDWIGTPNCCWNPSTDWIGQAGALAKLDNECNEVPGGVYPRSIFNTMYQACGGEGLHIGASVPWCGWVFGSNGPEDIEVYIGFETHLESDCYTTQHPTSVPTKTPTTANPTAAPSVSPTQPPSLAPSKSPSITPSLIPTLAPIQAPSLAPSTVPTTPPSSVPSLAPSLAPSVAPTESNQPTISPSQSTNNPTLAPSLNPSFAPSIAPTFSPTNEPSNVPSKHPSVSPTITPVITNYTVSVEINKCGQQQKDDISNEILEALNDANVVITNTECDDDTIVVSLSIKTPPGAVLEKNVIKGAIEEEIENDDRFGDIDVEEIVPIENTKSNNESADMLTQVVENKTIFITGIIIAVLVCCILIMCCLICASYYGKHKAQTKMIKMQSIQLSKMQSMSSVTGVAPVETNEAKEGNEQNLEITQPITNNVTGETAKLPLQVPVTPTTPMAPMQPMLGNNAQIVGDTSNLILNSNDLPKEEEDEYEYYESDSNEMMYNDNNKHRTVGDSQNESIEHGVLVTPGDQ